MLIGCSTSAFLFIMDPLPSQVTQIQEQAMSNWFPNFEATNLEKELTIR